EVPDVEIHPLAAQHLGNGIFTGWQWLFRRQLDPPTAELLHGCGYESFVGFDFAVRRDLDAAGDALAVLDFRSNDFETLDRRCFAFRGSGAARRTLRINVHVDGGHASMRLDPGANARQFDGLLGARERSDRRPQDVL